MNTNQKCIESLQILWEAPVAIDDETRESISHAITTLETIDNTVKPKLNRIIERLEEIT